MCITLPSQQVIQANKLLLLHFLNASDCLQKGDRGQNLISLIVGQGCKNTKVPNTEEPWYLLIREQEEKTCKKKILYVFSWTYKRILMLGEYTFLWD